MVEKQEKPLQRLYIKASQLWSSDYDNFLSCVAHNRLLAKFF